MVAGTLMSTQGCLREQRVARGRWSRSFVQFISLVLTKSPYNSCGYVMPTSNDDVMHSDFPLSATDSETHV